MMTDEEIVEKVSSFPARMVILTGGEPSLWIDKALISRLREAGKPDLYRDQRHTPLARRHRLGDLLAQGERPGGIGKDRRDKGGLYRARTCPHTPKSPHGTISCNPAPAKIRKR